MVLRVLIFLCALNVAFSQLVLSKVEFSGNTTYSRSQLLPLMKSIEGEEFKTYFAYTDQRAITNFYKFNGYIDVEVNVRIELDRSDPQARKLVFTVLENNQSVFGYLHFRGNKEISTDKFVEASTVEEHNPFQEKKLFDLKQYIERLYHERGKLDVQVSVIQTPKASDRYTRDVDVIITENQTFYFRNLYIVSAIDSVPLLINESIIKDEVVFEKGDVYNTTLEAEIQKNLHQLEIFQSVSLRKFLIQQEDSTLSDSIDLSIELIEKRNYFSLSAGISTTASEEYVKRTESDNILKQLNYELSMDLGKRNLKGTGTDVGLLVNPSWYFDENGDFRNFSTRFKLYSRIINFPFQHFHSNLDFTELIVRPQLGYLERFQINYLTRNRIGVRSFFDINFLYDRNNVTSSLNDLQLRRLGFNDYNIFSVATSYRIDNRNNSLNPRSGSNYLATVKVSTASSLEANSEDSQYYTMNLEWRRYQPFFISPRNITLATNLRYSTIIMQNEDHPIDLVPKTDRLYVGNSIRGYNPTKFGLLEQVIFTSLGADSIQYEPVGGRSLFAANFELRFSLHKILKDLYLQTFFDVAGLWPRTQDISLSSLRYGAGFGFSYNLGVLLIRIEYGFKLDRKDKLNVRNPLYPNAVPSESPGRFSFGLSYHF